MFFIAVNQSTLSSHSNANTNPALFSHFGGDFNLKYPFRGNHFFYIMCVSEASKSYFDYLLFSTEPEKLSWKICIICHFPCCLRSEVQMFDPIVGLVNLLHFFTFLAVTPNAMFKIVVF